MIKEYLNEPIRAQKWASIYIGDYEGEERTRFIGMGWRHIDNSYTINNKEAICNFTMRKTTKMLTPNKHIPHVAPQLQCSCGWYGLKNPREWKPSRWDDYMRKLIKEYAVLLDVEFYGKIIECQYGYRAQYQRILNVRIPKNEFYVFKGAGMVRNTIVNDINHRAVLANELGTEIGILEEY